MRRRLLLARWSETQALDEAEHHPDDLHHLLLGPADEPRWNATLHDYKQMK